MAAHAHAEPGEAFVEETINLLLKWQQTWEENEADYSAFSSVYKGAVGRIYRHDAGPSQGQWLWSMVADGYDISRAGPCSGHDPVARRWEVALGGIARRTLGRRAAACGTR